MHISIKDVVVDFMSQNKGVLFSYAILSLATPISNVYLPHLYGKIIAGLSEAKTVTNDVKFKFMYIILLWLIVQLMWTMMNIFDSYFIPQLQSHVRKHVVEKVIDTYRENYSEQELGSIMADIVRLPDEVKHMFTDIRNNILPMVYMLVFSIGYFTWSNPRLGLTSIAAISVYVGAAIYYSTTCISIWDEMNASHTVLHNEINDSFGNLLNIYVANQDNAELDRMDTLEENLTEKQRHVIRCTGNFRLALNISYIVLFCSLNILSLWLYSKKLIDIDEVVSTLIISLELISKMSSFVGALDRIMRDATTIRHIQKTLDSLGDGHTPPPRGTDQPKIGGDIVLKDFGIKYGDVQILKNLDMVFPQNSTTALVGKIGSGKTSIINAIDRLVPYQGNIYIGGQDISDISIDHLRENILYVPQNPRLFNRSIYENIAYGTNVTKQEVQMVLDKYHLDFDLDKKAGKFGQGLSGGQRQIVYLLRCLIRNPSIILLDEPTASLDYTTRDHIMKILKEILLGRTVIIVTHDQELLNFVDNVKELYS